MATLYQNSIKSSLIGLLVEFYYNTKNIALDIRIDYGFKVCKNRYYCKAKKSRIG